MIGERREEEEEHSSGRRRRRRGAMEKKETWRDGEGERKKWHVGESS